MLPSAAAKHDAVDVRAAILGLAVADSEPAGMASAGA
jgi:hypothetical protein